MEDVATAGGIDDIDAIGRDRDKLAIQQPEAAGATARDRENLVRAARPRSAAAGPRAPPRPQNPSGLHWRKRHGRSCRSRRRLSSGMPAIGIENSRYAPRPGPLEHHIGAGRPACRQGRQPASSSGSSGSAPASVGAGCAGRDDAAFAAGIDQHDGAQGPAGKRATPAQSTPCSCMIRIAASPAASAPTRPQ